MSLELRVRAEQEQLPKERAEERGAGKEHNTGKGPGAGGIVAGISY